MSVLSQTFFPLVGCHFMSLSFLSAWHNYFFLNYFTLVLTVFVKDFAGLKAGML